MAQKISQQPGVGQVSVSGGDRRADTCSAQPGSPSRLRPEHERHPARCSATIMSIRRKEALTARNRRRPSTPTTSSLPADQYRRVIVAYRKRKPDNITFRRSHRGEGRWRLVQRDPGNHSQCSTPTGRQRIQVVDGIKALLPQVRAGLPAAVNSMSSRPDNDDPCVGRGCRI